MILILQKRSDSLNILLAMLLSSLSCCVVISSEAEKTKPAMPKAAAQDLREIFGQWVFQGVFFKEVYSIHIFIWFWYVLEMVFYTFFLPLTKADSCLYHLPVWISFLRVIEFQACRR